MPRVRNRSSKVARPLPGLAVGALAVALAAPSFAGEYAMLASGQRMYADRHESTGATVLLYRGEGSMELPAAMVVGFVEAAPQETAGTQPQPAGLASEDAQPLGSGETGAANAIDPTLEPTSDPRALVHQAAAEAGLPPEFVESVALVESAFRPDAISPKGAVGVMQLMPETAAGLGVDPYDLHQNIAGGARLLRELLLKYDGDVVKALAAYNAGPDAVDRYHGLPPYNETRHYVNRVIGAYRQAGGE